jgi:hypothetical protein
MRLNTRHLALIAVAASLIGPAGAAARPIDGANENPSARVATTCGTDYSKNSATGEYCVDPSTGVAPITAQPSAPAAGVVAKDASFSWADAFTGAGAAIGVLLVGAGAVTLLIRRRRDSTTLVGPGSPSIS